MKGYQEELTPSIKNYKVNFAKNYSQVPIQFVASHWHSTYEILYIRRGQAKQQLNAEIIDVGPGDLIVICPGDVHATETNSSHGCDIDFVQFSVDLIYNAKELLHPLHSTIIHPDNDSIKKLFDALLQNNLEKRNGNELITTGLICTLCGFLLQLSQKKSNTKLSNLIKNICIYTQQESDIRLETVAAYFHYSPEHLSRKFHKEMGISYRNWCNRILMDRAIYLMKSEENTIALISDALGYRDESSFIRSFKRIYGITPSVYRHNQISSVL